jgi:hypothetical protein
MPSQQSSRNSSPGSSVTVERSGAQVTACLFLTGGEEKKRVFEFF